GRHPQYAPQEDAAAADQRVVTKVSRALLSVSDKSGIVEFARALAALGVQILSTGGTAKLLEKEGIAVTEVSAYTGFPEMLDGRVKTLHPKIHAGLLARRDDPGHLAALRSAGIPPIDLLVVNLYPFQASVADPDCSFEEAIENIDIGGPALLRAAAKNHAGVGVVVDPADYARMLEEMRSSGGISEATRFALAKKVFAHTAAYDGATANYLSSLDAGRRRRESGCGLREGIQDRPGVGFRRHPRVQPRARSRRRRGGKPAVRRSDRRAAGRAGRPGSFREEGQRAGARSAAVARRAGA